MANGRRRLVGRVVSDKMDKTVVVMIERRRQHPIYEKVVGARKKFMAHDESNEIPVGALVQIVESKPLSRHKRWVVESVLDRGEGGDISSVSAAEEAAEALGENVVEEAADELVEVAAETETGDVEAAETEAAETEAAETETDDVEAAETETDDVEEGEDES